ncbi:ATP synthase gamma chain 1, chloroplastic-like [Rosa rugosa]|uniref:ATP synthase gamma chain 1, chloroplastic-like n=1 Tax=Rosa rugosa TaxID=74645 RepID=UPI002B40AE9C|nr:ATP synthase gamma chain 1, chloroplastic-like [Rosa rugosa]
MKLVAAARVRRAQDAVINGRPFSETLVEVLYDINEQLQGEDVDIPLTNVRPVKKVALVVITSDRGLCGGFNNALTKKVQTRIMELRKFGLEVVLISVGKKGNSYFMRRLEIKVDRLMEGGAFPIAKETSINLNPLLNPIASFPLIIVISSFSSSCFISTISGFLQRREERREGKKQKRTRYGASVHQCEFVNSLLLAVGLTDADVAAS